MRRIVIASSIVLLPLMGVSCSCGEEVEPPGAPTLELGFSQVKMFDFDWEEVDGAEYYELLESAVPGAPYVPIEEDILDDGISIAMPLHLRHQASYALRACNAGGCSESEPVRVVSSLVEAVGYFKASNTDIEDFFGLSIALSGDGNTLAVAAIAEDSSATGINGNQADDSESNSGAVYVFARNAAGRWSQQAYVKASNTDSLDRFGWSIALSDDGDTLAVATMEEDSSATGINGNQGDESAPEAGAVYVFARNASDDWYQQAYVKASNTGMDDRFGSSIALNGAGNMLAVGAPLESSNATGIDGNQADDSAPDAGAVYVFTRSASGEWSQRAYIKASNTGASDGFGSDVALSSDGSTLAVGAPEEDSSAVGIGSTQADDSAPSAGAAYVFTRDTTGSWSQQAYVKPSETDASDVFGGTVALSRDGSILAIGALGESSSAVGIGGNQADDSSTSAGAVYVFVRNPADQWSQQAYVKASNTDANDAFSRSVALSGNGSTLAVGAYDESSGATGIGGNQTDDLTLFAGAVYLY